jgi:AraC family transcriptional regulator
MEFLDQIGIFKFLDQIESIQQPDGLEVFELRSSLAGRVRFQTGREIVLVVALNTVEVSLVQSVTGLPEFVGRVEEGHCAVYAPNTHVESDWKGNGERTLLCIVMPEAWYSKVLLREAPELAGVDGSKVRFRSTTFHKDSLLSNLVSALCYELHAGIPSGERLVLSICESCLMHVFRHHSANGQATKQNKRVTKPTISRETLERIDEFIASNLAGYVTVDAMAEVAHISKFHFIRSFRRATGYTPYEYLIHCRVNRARELLALNPGRSSLAEVASEVGFYDQSHLNRHFKQIVGMTPKQFAMSVQKSAQAAD